MTPPAYRLSVKDQQLIGRHADELREALHAYAVCQNATEQLRTLQTLQTLLEYAEDVLQPVLAAALDAASLDYRDERRAREQRFEGLRAA